MLQPQDFTEKQFIGLRYPQYFKTRHWIELNEQLIDTNPDAKCWICSKKSTLLLHHVNYFHLLKEKLGRDIYVLCFSCHTRVHFRQWNGKKTPLNEKDLMRRMKFLKYTFGIRNFRFGTLINTIVTYLMS